MTKQYKSHLAKPERNNQIIDQHLAGKSFYQLGKELGITPNRVAHIFHEATENKYKKTLVPQSQIVAGVIKK